MSDLDICRQCQGFRPSTLSACPHCDAVVAAATATSGPGRLERLCRTGVQVATGGALAMTLMACYGSPHAMHGPEAPEPTGCSDEEVAQDPNGVCSDSEKPMTMAGEGEEEGEGVEKNDDEAPQGGEEDPEPGDGEGEAAPDAP